MDQTGRTYRMNNNYKIYISIVLLATPVFCLAQNYQKTPLGLQASVGGASIEVQFYSSQIVRVIKVPEGNVFTKESLSVIKRPQQTQVSIKQHGDFVDLRSNKLKS